MMEETEGRLRKRKMDTYDQVKRRIRTKNGTTTYLERRDGRGIQKRRAIVMGTAAIENTVAGRYEWRDEGMREMKGVKKRHWEAMQMTTRESSGTTEKRMRNTAR